MPSVFVIVVSFDSTHQVQFGLYLYSWTYGLSLEHSWFTGNNTVKQNWLAPLSSCHLSIRCEISCTTTIYFGIWSCLTLHGDCAYCYQCLCVSMRNIPVVSGRYCFSQIPSTPWAFTLFLSPLLLWSLKFWSGVVIYIFHLWLSDIEFLILYTLAQCWPLY